MHNIFFALSLFVLGLMALSEMQLLITLVFFCCGISLFIKGIQSLVEDRTKQTQPEQAQPPKAQDQTAPPPPLQLWEKAGLPKPTKTLTIKVAGVTFECLYPNTYYDRQDVLKTASNGDKIRFQQYTYKGHPAIALIHESTNSDIGVVPTEMTEKFLEYINQYDVVGLIKDYDWFTPRKKEGNNEDEDFDDSVFSMEPDDEEDEDEEEIYTCKVLLCAYKRLEVE
jgi:hypothetical protein